MSDLPVNVGVGATIITRERFDQLSPLHQKVLRETAHTAITARSNVEG